MLLCEGDQESETVLQMVGLVVGEAEEHSVVDGVADVVTLLLPLGLTLAEMVCDGVSVGDREPDTEELPEVV